MKKMASNKLEEGVNEDVVVAVVASEVESGVVSEVRGVASEAAEVGFVFVALHHYLTSLNFRRTWKTRSRS